MMRNLVLAATAATVVAGASLASMPASAGVAGNGMPSIDQSMVENVQFYGGHRYCWYPGGWQGPGWYRCGWSHRRGYGWGGGVGWQGWGVPRGPGRYAGNPYARPPGPNPGRDSGGMSARGGSDWGRGGPAGGTMR